MSASDDFEAQVTDALAALFKPLTDAVSPLASGNTAPLSTLLARLGWPMQAGANAATVQAALGGFATDLTALATAVTNEDVTGIASAVANLIQDIPKFTAPGALGALQAPLNAPNFWLGTDAEGGSLAQQLFDYLVCTYLQNSAPFVFSVLRVLNIIAEEPIAADVANNRCAYLRRRIDFDHFVAIINNPGVIAQSLWSTSPFDASSLLMAIQSALSALGFQTFSVPPSSRLDLYYSAEAGPRNQTEMLAVPIYGGVAELPSGISSFEVSVNVMPVPPPPPPSLWNGAGASPPTGLSVFAEVDGNVGTSPISLLDNTLSLTVQAGFSAELPSVDIYPDKIVAGPGLSGTVNDQFTLEWTPDPPFIVLGSADGTCINVSDATVTFSLIAKAGSLEYKVELDLVDSQIVIDLGDADNFLTSVLGSTSTTIDLPGGVSWSSVHGFQFSGQAALEVSIPVHATLANVVDLDSIYIGIRPSNSNGLSLTLGLSGGLTFGPFSVVVDKLGMELDSTSSPDANGKLRVSGLAFGFKSPDGLGMSIDATPISGGGYIAFGQNQYVGWLELSVDILDLKVFGLLDTQPVSFLLIVQAGFPPIQLGFGFTLNDVGGLVGIDRTMSLDALRAALRAGTLDSTLFLDDPVSQAPQLTAVVSNMFPAQQGHYVFGPMCKIGWGEPTLIEAELGFLIEFPDPVRIAIVGGITCAIPNEDAALILINLDVLGTIDFGIELLTIDASLYDSRVLVYSLAGDMSFRLSWGAQTTFALSIGGFNPKYQPPPGFPSPMTPMTVSIGDGQNPYIGVSGYFAVTSNSLQFGALAELMLSAGGFTVHGQLGFDALFEFSPQFYFIVDIAASVDVLSGSSRLFCVDLALALSGPTPWNAHGTASFSILCLTVSFDANVTWGSSNNAALAPALDTIGPLTNALTAPKSWQAVLPSGTDVVASFVAMPPDPAHPSATILLHPMGLLQVSQTVLPLLTQIQRFGSGTPAHADYFDVQVVQAGATEPLTPLTAEFARGQFFILTDDQKLTDPSFDAYPSGATFGSAAFSSDPQAGVSRVVAYQDFIVDDLIAPAYQPLPVRLSQVTPDPLVTSFTRGRVLGTRAGGRSRYASTPLKAFVSVAEAAMYVVTDTSTLAVQTSIVPATGLSKPEASARLDAYLAANPSQRGQLQIMPTSEVPA